jgi:hypothetical protein
MAPAGPLSDLEAEVGALMVIRQLDLPRDDVLQLAEVLDAHAEVQADTEAQIADLAAGLEPTLEDLRETLVRNVDPNGGGMAALGEYHQKVRDLRMEQARARGEAAQRIADVVWGPETDGLEQPGDPSPAQPGANRPAGGGPQQMAARLLQGLRNMTHDQFQQRVQQINDRMQGEDPAKAARIIELLEEARALPEEQLETRGPEVARELLELGAMGRGGRGGGPGPGMGPGGQSPLMGLAMAVRRIEDAEYEQRKQGLIDRASGLVGEGADVEAFKADLEALLDAVHATPEDQLRGAMPELAQQAMELTQQYDIQMQRPQRPGRPGPGRPDGRGRARIFERLLAGDAARIADLLREYAQNLPEEE